MITHIFNSSVVSGPETLVLPALKHLGAPVTIVFLTETRLKDASLRPIEYAKSLGHEVHTVPVRGRYDRLAFSKLRDLLDQLQPSVVHAHDVKASVYLLKAKLVRPGLTASIVSTHHGASYRRGRIRLYEEFYVRRILPHFDLVLSVCEKDRLSIVKRGVLPNRVSLHLNGADRRSVQVNLRDTLQGQIRSHWKESKQNLPDPDEAIFLGAVARLSPEKRHDRMVKVLMHLRKLYQSNPVKPILLFFGSGSEEQNLRKLVDKLGLRDSVFFMGYSNTISEETAGFDLLLSLSDGEGIPINLLEAGWAGTPVVATRVGGIPDLISSSSEGILVSPKEKNEAIAKMIFEALSNPSLLKNMGQAFQQRIRSDFSETAWLDSLRVHYRTLSPAATL